MPIDVQKRQRLNLVLPFCVMIFSMAILGGCSDKLQEDFGLKRKAPDEFAVIKRAPLEMPPAYELRPPKPGAPRPQELSTDKQAKNAIFGSKEKTKEKTTQATDAEGIFLEQAGADIAQEDIRQVIDQELQDYEEKNEAVADKLLGIFGDNDEPPASVVNAKEEAERIKENTEQGKPITIGETPTITIDE